MSKVLMPKPNEESLRYCNVDVFNGATVISLFYNQGINGDDYIPRVLEDGDWVPDRQKNYKVWWHSTNPADPSDPGRDVLDYIENFTFGKKELIAMIKDKLSLLTVNRLFKLSESL